MKAPPPVASTIGSPASRRRITRRSPSRNSRLAVAGEHLGDGAARPPIRSRRRRRGTAGRAGPRAAGRCEVLPAPIRPTSTMLRPASAGRPSRGSMVASFTRGRHVARSGPMARCCASWPRRSSTCARDCHAQGARMRLIPAPGARRRAADRGRRRAVASARSRRRRTPNRCSACCRTTSSSAAEAAGRWTATSRRSSRCRRPSGARRAIRSAPTPRTCRTWPDSRPSAAKARRRRARRRSAPICARCTGRWRPERRRGGSRRCAASTGSWRGKACARTTRPCCSMGRRPARRCRNT